MRTIQAISFCIALFVAVMQSAGAATYTVTNLPPDFQFRNNVGSQLSATTTFDARSLDDWDLHTTLTLTDRNGAIVSQLVSPNHTTDRAASLSDTGIVVGVRTFEGIGIDRFGNFEHGGGEWHAFIFADGVFTDINETIATALGGDPKTINPSLSSVNNVGDTSGTALTSDGFVGFLYRNGVVTNLGLEPHNSQTRVGDINNFDQVTGSTGTAFIYSSGVLLDLGLLGAGTQLTIGRSINDAGQVTGIGAVLNSNGGSVFHAFLYEGGHMLDLGTLGLSESEAFHINRSGVVVGDVADVFHPQTQFGFIHRNGQTVDLNTLVDPASLNGGVINSAIWIGDDGTIVARVQSVDPNPPEEHKVLLTPTTPPAIDPAVFNFEGGTQGFESNGEPIITVAPTTVQKFAGEQALAMQINATGFASVHVLNPSAQAGRPITFHVYIPSDAHIDWVQPFAQEGESGNWGWHGQWTPIEGLQIGAWNSISVDVPADAKPLNSIGLEFFAAQTGGTIYLDSVDYGTTLDPAQYNFESGTQGWESSGSFASVATSTAQHFAGMSSLAIKLNNATFASVHVLSPSAHAGQTISFHVYIPTGAPITSIQPFAQEGAAGYWGWHGSWTPIEGLQVGAWNTIVVAIPPDAQALDSIGLEISTSTPYDGVVYVDSVGF